MAGLPTMRPVTPIDYGAELAGLNRGLLTTADTLIGNPLAGLLNTATGSDIQRGPILRYAQDLGMAQGSGGFGQMMGEMGSEMLPIAGDIAGAKKDWDAWDSGNLPGWAVPLAIAGLLPLVPPAARYIGRALPDMAGTPSAFGRDQRGMLGGVGAKTADMDALGAAKAMSESGVAREKVWQDTGWFQAPDGKWKFEIDDSGAGFKPVDKWGWGSGMDYKQRNPVFVRSQEVFRHPELAAAYPDGPPNSLQMNIGAFPDDSGSYGSGSWGGDLISIGRNADNEPNLSTTLHELQHGVQEVEGFAPGGSPSDFAVSPSQVSALRQIYDNTRAGADIAGRLWDSGIRSVNDSGFESALRDAANAADMPMNTAEQGLVELLGRTNNVLPRPQALGGFVKSARDAYRSGAAEAASGFDAFKKYQSLMGEAEARAVQGRMSLSPEQRRARPFWMDYDVPEADQVME